MNEQSMPNAHETASRGRVGRAGRAEELRDRSRAAFDAQAATYDEGAQGAPARRLYPLVARAVARAAADTPAPRILDAGCGTGALTARVSAEVPGGSLTGVDLSPAMVTRARERLAGTARVVLADVERLPFPDACFDVAYCNDSFHHYPDPERAAFQLWRVLAAGGTLVIGDVWQPAPARALMNAWMPHSREGDVRMYGERELRALLGTWFSAVSWRRVGLTACLAVARKER